MADQKILITVGPVTLKATLNNKPTARAIAQNLPIIGIGQRWGDEIYFDIPVEMALEPDARDTLEAGELGYWPTGNAFCIFFGPTPASKGNEIRAASAVNIVGKVEGELAELRNVRSGTEVRLELVQK